MASNVSVRTTTTRECDKIELGQLRITDEKVIEENTDDDEKRFQEIRYGKYVMAWRLKPRKMLGALIIEIIIGFLAILTATGKVNTLPCGTRPWSHSGQRPARPIGLGARMAKRFGELAHSAPT
jgi:hypothetical protein